MSTLETAIRFIADPTISLAPKNHKRHDTFMSENISIDKYVGIDLDV